jgi:hypothetical protein
MIMTHNVTMRCEHRGLTTVPDRKGQMRHWVCYLTGNRGTDAVDFYMGTGHGMTEPTITDVIGSLIMDARCARDYPSAHDFMDELGYDDYEIARNVMIGCLRSNNKLIYIFGSAHASELLEMEIE